MKKGLAIIAQGGKEWIGGLYYMKNMAFQLSTNKDFLKKYNIILFVGEDNAEIFATLPQEINVIKGLDMSTVTGKLRAYLLCMKFNIRFSFPHSIFGRYWKVSPIHWIPDFQHNHYPEFFPKEELEIRTNQYKMFADESDALVLSSNDCKKDFRQYYSSEKENVQVVPFVSFIEQEIKQFLPKQNDILQKYQLLGVKYAVISNQFWQHKNHIVVFKAVEKLIMDNPNFRYKFVFTGYPKDDRNAEYYAELMQYIRNPRFNNLIQILGFVDRLEQLCVMSNATFIIQPSLFEGWGTVVEDAKVLDKQIILSDIPVHREQMNEKCILFNPHDHVELAEIITKLMKNEISQDIEAGIADMYRRANEYSDSFKELLDNL